MKALLLTVGITLLLFNSCIEKSKPVQDMHTFALSRQDDLRLSVYITAHTVDRLLSTEAGRREAVSLMRCNGMTKVYLEVYRSGLVVSPELLQSLTDFFQGQGFEVVGGIATVPGNTFGVRQEGPLGWFNWQNDKTQNDIRKVISEAAPIFDSFIVDDFLCTGDTSLESKLAKGEKTWSAYRMDLLSELSESIFIEPAKTANPDIEMIIKYPQWYDRFHLFGYDVVREPALYDKVWVGTESRGQYTQRFGFVQPYEGFVNYRWLAGLSGDKIGGAWFDHGDCDAQDFIEQAYQTVLAGAREIVFFNYYSYVNGHGGHHLVRTEFETLANLSKAVAEHPVQGIPAYKPPHSDAGSDLYIMDYIGMFGVPLIPVATYPTTANVVFLPTQAAADPDIFSKINNSLTNGCRIILTTGFISAVKETREVSTLAGIELVKSRPVSATSVILNESREGMKIPLDLGTDLTLNNANPLLEAWEEDRSIPFIIENKEGNIFVLNSHTFSQEDFDAVGEVLLCPRQLGMLEVPRSWANEVRKTFNIRQDIEIDAPTRVTYQPLGDGSFVMHNYNREEVGVLIKGRSDQAYTNVITGDKIDVDVEGISITMAPRSRMWFQLSE